MMVDHDADLFYNHNINYADPLWGAYSVFCGELGCLTSQSEVLEGFSVLSHVPFDSNSILQHYYFVTSG